MSQQIVSLTLPGEVPPSDGRSGSVSHKRSMETK